MSVSNSDSQSATLKRFIATGFGSGLLKPAPGTWGSLAALLLAYAIHNFINLETYFALSIGCLLCCGLNFWSAEAAVIKWGKDPSEMVMDEFAGLFLALALTFEIAPISLSDKILWWEETYTFLVIFLIFRFFDIIKPLGINRLQQLSGSFGILIDDLAAGGLTFLTIYTIYLLI